MVTNPEWFLTDLQLATHRIQVPEHLLSGNLWITATKRGQQPPMSFDRSPRRLRAAAVTVMGGLDLAQ